MICLIRVPNAISNSRRAVKVDTLNTSALCKYRSISVPDLYETRVSFCRFDEAISGSISGKNSRTQLVAFGLSSPQQPDMMLCF